jgi:pimeloyl-ACP methyl ester carboxylesterase
VILVLVHGAYTGASVWERVAPRLQADGFRVVAPTLTGLGERCAELTPQVDLRRHVHDVVAEVGRRDLHGVVLVGHSYGGMVITGAARLLGSRLVGLVYLDAFVPDVGESVVDLWPELGPRLQAQAAALGDGWRLAPPPPAESGLDRASPKDREWMLARRTPMPYAALTQPLPGEGAEPSVPCGYVLFTQSEFGAIARRARARSWDCYELEAPHCALVTHAPEVAAAISEAVCARSFRLAASRADLSAP